MPTPKSNRNFIIIFAIITIPLLIYGIMNFGKAFHQIGINFQVTHPQALSIAREFLETRHFDLQGFEESVIFTYDGGAKLFLEKELGAQRMASLAQDTIDIWFWRVRFFKPLQKLEYTVHLSPAGELQRFERQLEENASAPRLEKDAAQILAEQFLLNRMGIDVDEWELVEGYSEDMPNRRDHRFTYEMKGYRVADAPYRMSIGVQGAEVSSFRRFVKVPEEWYKLIKEDPDSTISAETTTSPGKAVIPSWEKPITAVWYAWWATSCWSAVLGGCRCRKMGSGTNGSKRCWTPSP